MSNLILSAFSDEYSENFTEQCEALNGFNIKFMEIRGVNGKNISELDHSEINDIKGILSSHNITLSAIGSPIGKTALNGDIDAHFKMAEKLFQTAEELCVKNIRMFSFYAEDGKNNITECKTHVFDLLERLVRLSEKYNVTLCHENEALIYGESPERVLEIIKHFEGKIKCVFDMGNFVLDGYNPIYAYNLLNDYIEYFHIKDSLYAGAIVPAGKGEAEIKKILDIYKKSGKKDTYITLEPHLQTFSGLNALVGKSFDNPYKFEDSKTAFIEAVKCLNSII